MMNGFRKGTFIKCLGQTYKTTKNVYKRKLVFSYYKRRVGRHKIYNFDDLRVIIFLSLSPYHTRGAKLVATNPQPMFEDLISIKTKISALQTLLILRKEWQFP